MPLTESLKAHALRELMETTCPVCKGEKAKNQSFCRECFFSLPVDTRAKLYRTFSEGYAEIYDGSSSHRRSRRCAWRAARLARNDVLTLPQHRGTRSPWSPGPTSRLQSLPGGGRKMIFYRECQVSRFRQTQCVFLGHEFVHTATDGSQASSSTVCSRCGLVESYSGVGGTPLFPRPWFTVP
jgi:hypothetical protein